MSTAKYVRLIKRTCVKQFFFSLSLLLRITVQSDFTEILKHYYLRLPLGCNPCKITNIKFKSLKYLGLVRRAGVYNSDFYVDISTNS